MNILKKILFKERKYCWLIIYNAWFKKHSYSKEYHAEYMEVYKKKVRYPDDKKIL